MVQLSPLFILASLAVVAYSIPVRPAHARPVAVANFDSPVASFDLDVIDRDVRALDAAGGQSITGDIQGLGSEIATASEHVVNSLATFANSLTNIALDPRTVGLEIGKRQSMIGAIEDIGSKSMSELVPAVEKSSLGLVDRLAAGVLNLRTTDPEETDPFDEVHEQPILEAAYALLEDTTAAAMTGSNVLALPAYIEV